MLGTLVKSKAGHDKDKIYIVIEETDQEVYLVDGVIRTLEKPKKKRKKHIQRIRQSISKDVKDKMIEKDKIYNEEIKRQIKLYNKGGIACQKQT